MSVPATQASDLRRAPLTALRAIDFRDAGRDFWADEAAVHDRFVAAYAGLDDAAWTLGGAARSDAGGPDWSLGDHVGHVVDWLELGAGYVGVVLAGGAWPADDDYEGGDFDRFNETRRSVWAGVPPRAVRARLATARAALLPLARRLPLATIRSDDAWGWVWMVLHGHAIDHLAVIEPWTDRLRRGQATGEPFTPDPRPAGDGSPAAVAAFWSAEASVFGLFDELVRPIPVERWEEPGPTPDWTLKDHVAHLARWFEACATAIDEHLAHGGWPDGPAEGIDAWNAREVAAARSLSADDALRRFDAGHERLTLGARRMAPRDLASPEAGEWIYECLHGHVRAHLAMIGPWCARIAWPGGTEGAVD